MRALISFFCFLVFTTHVIAGPTTKFLWNLGFAIDADVTPFKKGLRKNHSTFPPPPYTDPTSYIGALGLGDIVWVQSCQVKNFYENVLPTVQQPFILVINDGDESFPQQRASIFDVDSLVNDPRVAHIFTQNYDLLTPHPKITPLPIGMDFHTITSPERCHAFGEEPKSVAQQEHILKTLLSTFKPTHQRKKKAYVDFQLADRGVFDGESRTSIFNELLPTGLLEPLLGRVPRLILWEKKGEYAFSISPRGAGLDCHRTWEDLVLGCIVIVKTSPLDPLYEGLPVVIVKEWSEVNEKNFNKWLKTYGDAFTNPQYRQKLTHSYWMNMIRLKQKEVRSCTT